MEGGKYYITCPEFSLLLKGSSKNADLLKGDGSAQLETAFSENMTLNISFENDYIYVIPTQNGKFNLKTELGYIGLTKGGSPTCSSSCPNNEFDITIDENGICTIGMTVMAYNTDNTEKGMVSYYLGGSKGTKSPLINLYKDNKANIVIYKVC